LFFEQELFNFSCLTALLPQSAVYFFNRRHGPRQCIRQKL